MLVIFNLNKIDFTPGHVTWFRSSFMHCTQRVLIGSPLSAHAMMKPVDPQENHPATLFYCLFINDLLHIVQLEY